MSSENESESESGSEESEVESEIDSGSGEEYSDEEEGEYRDEDEGSEVEDGEPPIGEGEESDSEEEEDKLEGPTMSMVDLDALEEERIQLEEQVLSFAIFTKRKNLDPLGKELFEESEHDKMAKVEDLNAEMQDTEDYFDSLHENFQKIASKLEADDDDDDDPTFAADGDEEFEEDGEGSDEDDDGEEAHKSLEAVIREHSGDEALISQSEEEESESEEEEGDKASGLPDFSSFKNAAEATLRKKNKRVSGQSNLEKIVEEKKASEAKAKMRSEEFSDDEEEESESMLKPQPTSKPKPPKRQIKRSVTMPARPGEAHLFFDWRQFKKTASTQQPAVKRKLPVPVPPMEEDPSDEFYDDDDEPEPSSYDQVLELLDNGSDSDDESNGPSALMKIVADDDGDKDDKTTFRPSRSGSPCPMRRKGPPPPSKITTPSRKKSKDKGSTAKRELHRSKTAPPGTMRRPGEEFFDWKKFASEQRTKQRRD